MSKFADTREYDETMQEWGFALADLSTGQLKRGIELSIKTLSWPPDIAEFITLAKGCGLHGLAYQSFRKALPKPINRELALSALANIRAGL